MKTLRPATKLLKGSAPLAVARQPFGTFRYFIRPIGATDAYEVQSLTDAFAKSNEVIQRGGSPAADILDADGALIGSIDAFGKIRLSV